MSLSHSPELRSFFSRYIADVDTTQDEQAVKSFISAASPDQQQQALVQAQALLQNGTLVETLGMEANRWFGDAAEAKEWLQNLITLFSQTDSGANIPTKDSNGTLLAEGDSVTVIKDLKVKGGSSDLKRGTLIKKIHLIGDPENIECNVDGSTLVLKTQFLKKA